MKKLGFRNLKISKKQKLLIASVLVVLGFLSVQYITKDEKNFQPASNVVTYSTDKPSEDKPGDGYQWAGGPQDPKKILIPSVGIDAFIQNVGVDQNKEVAVPNNIHIAGWFVDSVRPGSAGLSVIDGHIDGVTQDGAVFKTLPNVQKDAEISVVSGDGSIKNFRVISSRTVPVEQAASVLFSQDPKVSSQLNLITCVGTFNTQTNRYADRIIVSAKLIQ